MSAILRFIGGVALLSTGAVALPHPDIIPSATITSVVDTIEPSATPYVTPPASTPTPTPTSTPTSAPPLTTPPAYTPSTHSLATGEAPYEGTCDWGYCNSLGLSVCAYWGGITGWDSYHQPLPGETFTTLGPCSTASAETTETETETGMVTTTQANTTTTASA